MKLISSRVNDYLIPVFIGVIFLFQVYFGDLSGKSLTVPAIWFGFIISMFIGILIKDKKTNFNLNIKKLSLLLIVLILFMIGINIIGFYYSTMIFIPTYLFLQNYKKIMNVFLVTSFLLLFFYYVVEKLLNIELP